MNDNLVLYVIDDLKIEPVTTIKNAKKYLVHLVEYSKDDNGKLSSTDYFTTAFKVVNLGWISSLTHQTIHRGDTAPAFIRNGESIQVIRGIYNSPFPFK